MLKKVLIANRGEIAVRIIRTCREMGIRSVAVHSDVDQAALHVRLADESVCIGPASPAKSYLNIPSIIAAAEITGADAIHPGYGFLSENAEFAATVLECGLAFVGPSESDIRNWGDKVEARRMATSLGIPTLPGSATLESSAHALREAERLGFPLMLKARAGGGGRGIKMISSRQDLLDVFETASHEALVGFGDGSLYLEKLIVNPRHIEFQVMADNENVWVLGERECSVQRRHQKLLEESPSPAVSHELRHDMSATISRAIKDSGYRSAGTLEFLMDASGELYFLEMNTRIQVEHPITEAVMGVDIVEAQLRAAAGEQIRMPNKDLLPRGHAIECRINAEDPDTFAPWPGPIDEFHPPGGRGIRVDSGVFGGARVPPHYDSLIFKVISHAQNRNDAIVSMRRALRETIVTGIRTNIALHHRILSHPDFVAGRISTDFLAKLALHNG
ncbi:MAG: acetyl-CoA carboxylase biotin carboxylase subunit [Polyangiales bacterium]